MVRRLCCVVALGASLMTSGCGVAALAGVAHRAPASSAPVAAGRPGAPAPGAAAAVLDGPALVSRVDAATLRKRTVHVEMRGTGVTASGDVRFDASGRLSEHVTVHLAGATSEVVVIGDRAWVRIHGISRGGRTWLAARSGGKDRLSRSLQPMFDQLAGLVPGAQMRHSLTGPVTRVGTTTTGGTRLTEYVAHPDAQQLLAAMPKAQADQLRTREITGIAVHVWVDRSFLPRRVTSTLTVSGQRVNTSMVLSRYGVPVSISAPPASQIMATPR